MSSSQHTGIDDSQPDDPAGTQGAGAEETSRPLTAWQVMFSAVAAAFGVQSSRNRERDFTHGRASHFIIAGIVFTVLFVLVMIGVVTLVLGSAG